MRWVSILWNEQIILVGMNILNVDTCGVKYKQYVPSNKIIKLEL